MILQELRTNDTSKSVMHLRHRVGENQYHNTKQYIVYQRNGIGTRLMDEAENRIKQKLDWAGIGFGVYQNYGAAQIRYISTWTIILYFVWRRNYNPFQFKNHE